MEFVGVDKSARSKTNGWKKQEWTCRHDEARVDNAEVENVAREKNAEINKKCSLIRVIEIF